MQQNYNKKRKLNKLKTSLLLLMLVCFAGVAQAQVYMHNGEQYLSTNSSVKFYDSGGASKGPDNFWLHWYGAGQNYTFTFYPETAGNAIKVEFGDYTAYTDNGNYNHALSGKYTLRLNDTWLYVYEGNAVDDSKLITAFTGTVVEPFTMMANGPITFRFDSRGGHTEEGWDAIVTAVAGTEYGLQKPVISKQVCSDDIVLNATTFGAQIRYTTNNSNPTVSSTLYENPFQINYTSTGTTVKAICVNGNNTSDYAEKLFKNTDATPAPRALVAEDIVRQENTIIITPPAVPDGINDTYGIIYTTGTHNSTVANPVYYGYNDPNNVGTYLAPDAWNGAMPGKIHFEWTTPNTDIKIAVVAQSCVKQSTTAYTYYFEKLQIPTPTIETEVVSTTDYTGKATITFANGYTMRYTTDGSTPTATSGQGNTTTSPFTVNDLTPGTTVKVIVYKVTNNAIDESYEPAYASELYLPGEGQSGSYGDLVILNDLEDHSWSYYKNATDLPTGYPSSLSSPDPRNVKITYKGNGQLANGNAASGVQVGLTSEGETENTFIFLKTLEKGTDGKYAYRVLPNPFYVRPKVGSTYYGFSHWKVTSITGGTIEGNPTTINGDTEIKFNPTSSYTLNGMSMEVVLEAVWDVAEVSTNGSFTNNYGVERMFYIVSDDQYSNLSRVNNRAVTYTSFYPNGTTNGTTAASLSNRNRRRGSFGNTNPNADVKIEYMILINNSSTLTGNGHNFIIGRGISASSSTGFCASNLYGLVGNSSSNFTMRIESGNFNHLYFLGEGRTYTGKLTAVLGSDYDRAKKDDTRIKLLSSSGYYSSSPADILVGDNCTLGSSSNVGSEVFHCTVKSGNFDLGVYGGSYQFYMSSPSQGNYTYGSRTLVVEGGVFSDIAGGVDYNGNTQAQNVGNHDMLNIRIKGGTIKGAVFGAAQRSKSGGHRRFVFTGGTINGWIAGGCNGTETENGEMYGDAYIYFGGKAITQHRDNDPNMNASKGGNIFGAGSGISGGTTVGQVYNSTVVVADNATVERDVYGGGNYGYVNSGAGHKSDIFVLGGSIGGSVFGGSNQQQGQIVNILMKEGTITGNIYGGSNTTGTVNGLATINVSGGSVNNVFGGGLGTPTNMAAGTVVNVSGGTINNNVYGGGEKGTVSAGNTVVSVSGGTMNDVFGAGKGESSGSKAVITGTTTVTVTGGTMANVYGGGENGNVAAGGGSGSGSETITLNQNVNQAIEAGKTYNFYDSGGANGNYGNSQNYTATFTYNGDITISFTSFATESASGCSDWDYMLIYDGTSSGTQIARGQTDCASANISAGSSFTATSGTMTIVWKSDGSYNAAGWAATITGAGGQQTAPAVASTVTISGGTVNTDVFGGGKMGTTEGSTLVNIKGNANVGQHVYGGALGAQGSVYVAGAHTVNMLGGYVHGNVYGGSRNANDAFKFNPGTFSHETGGNVIIDATNEETVCVVNISAGHIGQQVYSAGFFGNCYGSVYTFVGQNAIYNAPDHVETASNPSAGEAYAVGNLYIEGSVWAGGDWGTFTDHFGAPTISGKSNVYIDGLEYNTATTDKNNVNYMCIDGSVYGSGTSCDAGNKQHTVVLRNYGESLSPFETATRNFASIQRADHLVLDNVHVVFQGQGRINSLNVTEVYAMYWITNDVIVTGGSTLIMEAPADQMKSFISASCNNVYTATFPTSETNLGGYTAITPSTLSATPNKIRVNGGNYIKVYYDNLQYTENGQTKTGGYGMLKGYAYMMAAGNNVATCAYARPRWCANDNNLFHINDSNYDNRNDGGWVSYISTDNVFDLAGNAGNVQMAYENHTPRNGEGYFRIWRTTGQLHEREGVFDVLASGTDAFKYVDVEIELPAWRGSDYYYKFNTSGDGNSTDIDYGPEVMTFNSALYANDSWLSYNTSSKVQQLSAIADQQNFIKQNPNLNYGLVIMEAENGGASLSSPAIGETDAPGLIICEASDEFLAKKTNGEVVNKFTNSDNTVIPTVKFRLTFYDKLSTNKTYEPMYVTLVQCNANGDIKDQVKIKLVVNTSTVVGRDFTENVYAIMNGNGASAQEAHVQIVLPRFNLEVPGVESEFTVESIVWTPNNNLPDHGNVTINGVSYPTSGQGNLSTVSSGGFTPTKFAMEFKATDNYDGTTGWEELNPTTYDTKVVYDGQGSGQNSTTPAIVGHTGGRTQFSFDFGLYYNGQVALTDVTAPELMGTIVYNMKFTNYGDEEPYEKTFKITLNVYRRGQGTRYYLDGVNGQNAYDGTKPDRAMYTLAGLFNRGGSDHKGILPGDDVYVVNQVTVNDELEWNGLTKGGNVNIYRYNGGHPLYDEETGIIGNSTNAAYTGNLVKVDDGGHMIMRGITMDGYYRTAKDEGTTVTSAAPLITIEDGGTLELNQKVTLQKNYNTNNGGAVVINEGGTLMMNQNASIKDNLTDGNGGGVYMDGTMIASDEVHVWDNKQGNNQNNVYLASKASVLQIGVDNDNANYKQLTYNEDPEATSAKIGLSKSIDNFEAGVAEVVYSNEISWLAEPLNTQAIIVHDGNIYKLETGESANKLYWRDTWVTFQNHQPTAAEGGWAWNGTDNVVPISTEPQLAWFISLVNGENGQTASDFSGKTIVIKEDLDMKDHTWVPIGERTNVFKGTFEGNGHVIEGLISSLNRTDLGMFGITEGATIQNVVAKANFNGTANNVGTFIGTMKGGLLSNVEAAGDLTGDAQYTKNIGGLVGETQAGSTIHSAFAVNTITAQRDETMVGGLVATNAGDLYNSYSNVTVSGTENTKIGGLVGENNGHVENCYAVIGTQTFPAFANINNKEITLCYADKDNGYVKTSDDAATLTGHGNYSAPLGRKALGYMYDDNKVTLVTGQTNNYVATAILYAGGKIDKWPGMLCTLNQWVKANPKGLNPKPTTWFRPTSGDINGDLPILGFTKDNSLATQDGKFLHYSAYNLNPNTQAGETFSNGLDNLFTVYNGKTANMFLYGNATDVTKGNGDNMLFINEDAVLTQAPISSKDEEPQYNAITATVGVTFDNSDHGQNAYDYYGNKLKYDWHFMSTPLADALTGATYSGSGFTNQSGINIDGMTDGYFPNGLNTTTPAPENAVKWDFYTYYEPHYHWINLKRGPGNHWHTDGGAIIPYVEDDNTAKNATFVPGKGYMMAISQDSYMSNSGVLNNGNVPITLTNQEPQSLQYNKGWNLVGNPYQAYLDLKAVRTGANASYYIYDAESGDYVPYAVDASQNTVTPSRYIHPHQGFFMYSANDNNEFSFTQSMATTEKEDDSYFRGDEQINYPLVNLFARNQAGNNDLAIIELNRPEIGGATKMSFMTNANFELSAYLDGQDYGLLFTPEGTEKVPVHFTTQEDGTYTLTWDTQNGVFTSLLLVDNMTGTITDMLRSDHYTFDAKTSDYASRFYLTYACTGVEEVNEGDGSFAFFDGSEWVVNGKGQLDIIDVTGRVLFSKRIANEQNRVNLNNVAPGVYMMRVSDGKDTMVQKIVVR